MKCEYFISIRTENFLFCKLCISITFSIATSKCLSRNYHITTP